ncbi:MAG TPA: hypothetical protein PLM07_10140 [Candidatus Rifleibacterium sp.]|nr:hypothetical protein [Candidatus Rifleibacterium sp.]HPT46248.1 hypothetical protein [Candidatus Rifleibacterium sp.]
MLKSNRCFLLGVITASFLLTIFAGNHLFQMVIAGDNGSLPRELRLGAELGLIGQTQLTRARLNRSVSQLDFGEKLSMSLELLGFEHTGIKNLISHGLLPARGLQNQMTRKDALETLARTCAALKDAGLINLADNDARNYSDYRIPEKYRHAVTYLQKKYVVRGFPDGSMGSSRKLSLREAVFFVYRFYEAVAADLMGSRENQGISFVDMPLSHPVMGAVKNLTAAGAFDKIILRPSFDGESFITVTDLTEILNGIFAKAGKESDQIRLKTIFADTNASSFGQRRQLALVLEYLLDTFAKDRLNASKINYKDVSIEQPEFESLVKLAGCGLTMGYGDGRFAGTESLTWFETVNLLDAVIKYSAIVAEPPTRKNRLAVKSDIENLKTLLRAKREKIRQILRVEKSAASTEEKTAGQ